MSERRKNEPSECPPPPISFLGPPPPPRPHMHVLCRFMAADTPLQQQHAASRPARSISSTAHEGTAVKADTCASLVVW